MRAREFNYLMELCGIPLRKVRLQPSRPCIVCRKLKCHNNAFCSAACKRVYERRTGETTGDE